MSMSKQDFIAIASAVRDYWRTDTGARHNLSEQMELIHLLGNACQHQYKGGASFDRERFNRACLPE